ncbi:MAG TPA: hypothetical protein VIR45_07915 [Kiloniellaceae bacterium]
MARESERERAAQPWSLYATPNDVLADRSLSDAERRSILESWERDLRGRADAEDGNAAGGGKGQLEALATLPAEGERPMGSRGPRLTGEEARQGEIILKTPTRKAIFIGGIVLAAVLCVFFFYQASL